MPNDALSRRFFAAIALATFQTSGIVQLAASRLLTVDEDPRTKGEAAGKRGDRAPARISAELILSRNPFDPETDPLNAQIPIDFRIR